MQSMTRKEAIEILKKLIEAMQGHVTVLPTPERIAAIRVAIASLETDEAYQLEYENPTTKNDLGVDCISRDVVKNYIQAHIHEIITESGEDKNKHTNRVLRSMIHGVNCMPSVTPQEPKTGHWIEKAEDYYKAINEYGGGVDENTDYFTDDIACPKCLSKFSTIDNETERFRHCPNCGAKMVEPKESEVEDGNDN